MQLVEIEITNWDKYNPKRDQTTYTWLRLNNDFFISQELFDLNNDQKMIWILILCMASRANEPKLSLSPVFVCRTLGVKESVFLQTLEIFHKRGLTTAHDRARPPAAAARPQTTPTNVRNVRTERTDVHMCEAEVLFEQSPKGGLVPDPAPHPMIVTWNTFCGEKLPKVLKSNSTRNRKIAARWPDLRPEEWAEVVKKIAASSFCRGSGATGWRASFDWLLQPETHLKVMEGKYDNPETKKTSINEWLEERKAKQ